MNMRGTGHASKHGSLVIHSSKVHCNSTGWHLVPLLIRILRKAGLKIAVLIKSTYSQQPNLCPTSTDIFLFSLFLAIIGDRPRSCLHSTTPTERP